MQTSQLVKFALVSASLLTLVGCATTKKNPNAPTAKQLDEAGMASSINATVAQTYGLKGAGSYQAANSQPSNASQNSENAPSNQVYYFGFDSNRFSAQDMQALNAQGQYLATHPQAKIRLEGNTDLYGSREYNVALGWRRDQAVARLLEQQGVAPSQIQMVSYGKEHPVVFSGNKQQQAKNRRVNLIYKAS